MELLEIMAKELRKAVKLIAKSVIETDNGERYIVKRAKYTGANTYVAQYRLI